VSAVEPSLVAAATNPFSVFAEKSGMTDRRMRLVLALDRAGDQQCAVAAAAGAAGDRVVFRPIGDARLVDFDHAFERVPLGIDYRAPELVQQQPRLLV